MSYKSFLQNKMKTSPTLGYSSNFYFSKTQKNKTNIFGINKSKNRRDITPIRKYKQIQKKKIANNIKKNNNVPIKNLKIEGDLISGSNFRIKRAKTPINNSTKKNISSKSENNKNNFNLNSLSVNNSIKLNKQSNNRMQKSNNKPKFSKPTNSYYSPINKNTKMNFNRSITPNNKMNLNKKSYNNKQIKFSRSITPIPKSKFTLNKSNSKLGFGSNLLNYKKYNQKSQSFGFKNKNFHSSNPIYSRINSGIQGITQNKPIFNKIGKLKADENNVVFVNFHRDNINDIEPFGTRDLFKKIHDFFIISEDYQDSLNNLNKEIIEKRGKKLRAEAEKILLPNKIWGAVVGIVPLVDLALQKFVIKKNAIEKVGQIFGFDSEFIDEVNRRESEEITREDIAEGTGRVASSAISYTSGGIAIGEGVASAVQASQLGVQAAQLGTQAANLGAKAAQLTQQANNMNSIAKFWYSITGTTSAVSKMAASTAAQASAAAAESASLAGQSAAAAGASTLSKFAGVGCIGIGCLIGIGVGGYTTYKFCEELLDKFENYFKNQPFIVRNSYIQAAQYFLI